MRCTSSYRHLFSVRALCVTALLSAGWLSENTRIAADDDVTILDGSETLRIETPTLQAAINKQGYVTGIMRQSLVDRKTGFRDAGFGLDIVDWIMEPGSDLAYRDQLDKELVYQFGNAYHGNTAKRSIEGPQICTRAGVMSPRLILGEDFVAVRQQFQYQTAAPGKMAGSQWTQWIVFPEGERFFISMDRIDAINDSDAMFLRLDMPGHIRHKNGDSFESVYLSYHGKIPASAFSESFAPDEKFLYQRNDAKIPERFIRAYRLRNPDTGQLGPWLAGMTLEPGVVSEAWCHQRGYVCMIEEFGGRPIKAGESFSAAFLVGYFDSIEEMEATYDRYKGHTGLSVSVDGWKLTK